MNDPRRGKPSASALECMALCHGRANAERGLPEIIVSDDGESGTLIHDALADDQIAFSKLTSEQMRVYEEMSGKARRVAEELGFDPEDFESHERLWFDDEFSGEVDRIYVKDGRAFIPDFKSGFRTVTQPVTNTQLAALAVLAMKNKGVAQVFVTIIPRLGKVPEPAVYDLESGNKAYGAIQNIIADSANPNAPRTAGDVQCRFCRARTSCEAFAAYAAVALAVNKADLPSLPADRLALAIDRIPAANNLIAALKAEGKRRLAEGDEEFSKLYELSEGDNMRTIVKLPELFERVKETGVTVDQFTAACSMDIGAVKGGVAKGFVGLIHLATGLNGVALKRKSDELLEGFVEEKKKAGSLERKELNAKL